MIIEGALTHFSAGEASNKEKPSAVHGVSHYIKQDIILNFAFAGTRD